MTQDFRKVAAATIGADGTATAEIVLNVAGKLTTSLWSVGTTTDRTATGYVPSQCTIYRNGVSSANYIEGTNNGEIDSSTTSVKVFTGETLVAYWTGGVAGSKATFRVEGDFEPGG